MEEVYNIVIYWGKLTFRGRLKKIIIDDEFNTIISYKVSGSFTSL